MMVTEYEYDGSFDYVDYRGEGFRDSDEDTEDASETESMKPFGDDFEYMEVQEYRPRDYQIKEQIYRDKLATLRDQLAQLEAECHPEFVKSLEKINISFEERRFAIHCCFEWQQERISTEYTNEERAAVQDFNDRRIELKENLLADLEEKKRLFEADPIELAYDTAEPKPTTTRKLRRRPNDPIPMPDRRRRASPAHINYLLDDSEIADDLKLFTKIMHAAKSLAREENRKNRAADRENNASGSKNSNYDLDSPLNIEARIEDGKLFYDKKWFHRGQNLLLESADGWKKDGIIHQIGSNEIWIKKSTEATAKNKVTLADLQTRKYLIQRRS